MGEERRDELGKLSDALIEMVGAQCRTITEAMEIVERSAESADTMRTSSNQSSESVLNAKQAIESVVALCESNSASLQESNAGMEEMSAASMIAAQAATDCAEFISQTTVVSGKTVENYPHRFVWLKPNLFAVSMEARRSREGNFVFIDLKKGRVCDFDA